MQIIRTILWVILTALLVAFIAMNWIYVPVNFWPLNNGNYLHLQWPVGLVALLFFLFGAIPMWLVHRATVWRLHRRIQALENTVLATSAAREAALPPSISSDTPLQGGAIEPERSPLS